jgi:hypothetical protein
MPSIVLTIPILAGKVEAWRRFCQELSGSRLEMYEESRRRMGIGRERMTLVETPFGSTATTTLEAQNIDRTLAQIVSSKLPFDSWYRERLEELHGVNLSRYQQFEQPAHASQPQELLLDWSVLGHRRN